mmetsp:Transcript_29823/g.85360  ORF Transcript_29823/g.85360 Transcript_29823/m.85360 type:complete len:282 (+) Transcript_29823:386-1231(+)
MEGVASAYMQLGPGISRLQTAQSLRSQALETLAVQCLPTGHLDPVARRGPHECREHSLPAYQWFVRGRRALAAQVDKCRGQPNKSIILIMVDSRLRRARLYRHELQVVLIVSGWDLQESCYPGLYAVQHCIVNCPIHPWVLLTSITQVKVAVILLAHAIGRDKAALVFRACCPLLSEAPHVFDLLLLQESLHHQDTTSRRCIPRVFIVRRHAGVVAYKDAGFSWERPDIYETIPLKLSPTLLEGRAAGANLAGAFSAPLLAEAAGTASSASAVSRARFRPG